MLTPPSPPPSHPSHLGTAPRGWETGGTWQPAVPRALARPKSPWPPFSGPRLAESRTERGCCWTCPPQGWVCALSLHPRGAQRRNCAEPPPRGATRPVPAAAGPVPLPRGPHNGCLSPCPMLQLDSSLPSSPLCVPFPPQLLVPRGSHGPHTCVGATGALARSSPPAGAREHPFRGRDAPSSFSGRCYKSPPRRRIRPQGPFPCTDTTVLCTHGRRCVQKCVQGHEGGVPGARPCLCCPVPVLPLGPRHHLHQRPTEPRTGLGRKGPQRPPNSSPHPVSCSLPAPRISPLCLLRSPLLPQFAPAPSPVCSHCSPSLLPLLPQFAPAAPPVCSHFSPSLLPASSIFGGEGGGPTITPNPTSPLHGGQPVPNGRRHLPEVCRAAVSPRTVSPQFPSVAILGLQAPRSHPPGAFFLGGGKHLPAARRPRCDGGDRCLNLPARSPGGAGLVIAAVGVNRPG